MAVETNTEEGGGTGEQGGTVMDAINEALGLGSDDAQNTGTAGAGAEGGADLGEEEGDLGADEGAEGDDSGDESGGDEAGGDEQAGKGAAEGADKPGVQPAYADLVKEGGKLGISKHNTDGTIKSAKQLAAEIDAHKKGGDAAGKGKQQQGAQKEPDPINDPIPKDVSQQTQQRMRTLIDTVRQETERATVAEGNFNDMMGGLQAANVTPEQYGETLSFLALFNSGDAAQQGKALDILEDMADKLSTLIGKERRSSDPLERHQDLIAEVRANKLSVERAREIARHRNQGAFRTELQNSAQATQRAEAQRTADLNTARTALNARGVELSKSDPLFMRKRAAIAPALKEAFKDLPPSKWLGAFNRAYAAVKVSAPARRQVPVQQPLRAGKNPAGSGANAKGATGGNDGGPKTMADAINQALAEM